MVRDKKGKVYAPKQVQFVTDLPRTAVGKIDKKVLRAPFWAGQARQV
jgi:fatty-acyl-CoA synthase